MHEESTPHMAPPAPLPLPVAPTPPTPKFAEQQPGKPDPIAVRVMASPPFVPVLDNPAPAGTPTATAAVAGSSATDPLAKNRHPDDPTKIIPKPTGPDQLAESPKSKPAKA